MKKFVHSGSRSNYRQFILTVLLLIPALMGDGSVVRAGEEDVVPAPGTFPKPGAGIYLAGELVYLDHVNRRGELRLVGDLDGNRYHSAPSHPFALLPYGTIRYHGAPAELRDIPIGTVLHGYFLLPAEGEQTFPPPRKSARYVVHQTQALSLEDDFSFYQRQKRSWSIKSVELRYDSSSSQFPPLHPDGDWRKTPIASGSLTATLTGEGKDGLNGEQKFTIDRSTRLWRENAILKWEDLASESNWSLDGVARTAQPGLEGVQVNLTWAPDWMNGQFHVTDVWLDQESQNVAAETQCEIHIRHIRHRWLPGWVDHVEHQPGGKGIVTVTLFGGMDPSLYEQARDQAKRGGGAAIAAAEWTLRSWWQDHDNKSGPIVEFKDLPDPPPGSSGLQVRVRINELLEGYRPGRIVRFRPNGFPNVKLPPEERVKNLDDR